MFFGKTSNILGLVIASNQVVYNVRVTHAFLDLCVIAKVPFLEPKIEHRSNKMKHYTYHRDDLTQVTHKFQVSLLIFISVWYNDLRPFLCKAVHKITT